jgi:hypothetical protein
MDSVERADLVHVQNLAGDEDDDDPPASMYARNVLDGSERVDISNAGGDFLFLEEAITNQVRAQATPK